MSIEVSNINPGRNDTTRSKRDDALVTKEAGATETSKQPVEKQKSDSTSVTLSTTAQSLGRIEEGLKDLPEVDAKRVEELRAAISDGSYEIDNQNLARKMLDLE